MASDTSSILASKPASARKFGRVNWMGLRNLYMKEVRRFVRVGPQTLLAPIISNLLYMAVFVLAFAELRPNPQAFMAFLAPGLVMLGILNNAASNSSSSIMTSKVIGYISDVLMPPLSSLELALGWIGGAVTRGVLVALATALALSIFTPLIPVHLWAVLFFGLSAAVMLAMIGVLSGLWAQKFDHLAVVNQFIILPLSFLSGTFYSVKVLPDFLQTLIQFNPLFYLIDGFRYGFLGTADSNITIGIVFVTAINMSLFFIVLSVLRSGWRIKS